MHYLIYQITNKINGKIYIGKHQTENKDDDYMGSGVILKRAQAKYGLENFEKTILHECASLEEMNAKEAEIVNAEFLARKDVYNLKVGGEGGFDYINATLTVEQRREFGSKGLAAINKLRKEDPEYNKQWHEHMSAAQSNPDVVARRIATYEAKGGSWNDWNIGKKHKESTKAKIGAANAILQRGSGNSHYGYVWIKNDEMHYNKSIPAAQLDEYLSKGWVKGRCMSYVKDTTL